MVCQSTLSGLSEHIKRSVRARQVGTQGPSDGHRQTKLRALIARTAGIECPKCRTIFGHFLRVGGFAIMHDAL